MTLKNKKQVKWSSQEDKILIDNIKSKSSEELSILLNRSIFSIKGRIRQLKLRKTLTYTEKDFLEAVESSFSYNEVSRKLGYKNTSAGVKHPRNRIGKLFLKLNPSVSHFVNKSSPIIFDEQQFLGAVSNSKSHREAYIKLGYSDGQCINTANRYNEFLTRIKPDISHFCLRSRASYLNDSKEEYRHILEIYFQRYVNRANKHNLIFGINIDDFNNLIKQECFYCGVLYTIKINSYRVNWSGVDRVDNDVGYIKENCVPCCKFCNKAKLNRKQTDYINHCMLVADYQRNKNG